MPFQQSIIFLSLPRSHYQVIPLLIKILQPLLTQLIIAIFTRLDWLYKPWGDTGFCLLGLAVTKLSSYIFTHWPSVKNPP